MFHWIGRSKRARTILNEMYSTISEAQSKKAKTEIERYLSESVSLADLERRQKDLERKGL